MAMARNKASAIGENMILWRAAVMSSSFSLRVPGIEQTPSLISRHLGEGLGLPHHGARAFPAIG
jgi:hypothetical protein